MFYFEMSTVLVKLHSVFYCSYNTLYEGLLEIKQFNNLQKASAVSVDAYI